MDPIRSARNALTNVLQAVSGEKIVVIGAGAMGNGIAQTAAVSGYQVTMTDVDEKALERGKAVITKSATKLAEKEVIFCRRSFDRDMGFNGEQRGGVFKKYHNIPLGTLYPYLGCATITSVSTRCGRACRRRIRKAGFG